MCPPSEYLRPFPFYVLALLQSYLSLQLAASQSLEAFALGSKPATPQLNTHTRSASFHHFDITMSSSYNPDMKKDSRVRFVIPDKANYDEMRSQKQLQERTNLVDALMTFSKTYKLPETNPPPRGEKLVFYCQRRLTSHRHRHTSVTN